MSNSVLFVKHGFVKNNGPLKNGLGRFIPQLMRMTIKFDKENSASQGVREFIESDLVSFAKQNPHVAIYLKPRRHRSPVIVAEYLNGERHWQSLNFYRRQELVEWLDLFRTSSGKEYQVQTKYEFSETPSVQGMWNAFTNVDPEMATATFPLGSEWYSSELSASQRLKLMYENQKKMDQSGFSEAEKDTLKLNKQGE